MSRTFVVGRIGPVKQSEAGYCNICRRTVLVENPRNWDGWDLPVPMRTGECVRCHSTVSCGTAPFGDRPTPGAA